MMRATARVTAGGMLLALCAAPVSAQTPQPRRFVTLSAAAQAGAEITDRFELQTNAETGSIETRYPARTAMLVDGSVGFRFWRRTGIAAAGSRSTTSGRGTVSANIPHPFFDNRHRLVEGEATGLSRTETSAHVQLFYEVPTNGRWQLRLFAGPSYFSLEQDVVREVTANETFPYDTATFQHAVTGRATGSGLGFNTGADLSWRFARRVGAGLLVRYARASVDLNGPDSRTVSSDGGGLQAGAGIRFLF
ncbi:MAG: hypothetical protein WD227_15675 [Vicinamibacterales bacterium]